MISEKDNKIVYLIIILTCVFLSFSHSLYQVAINGGLTISEIIKYPEPLSPMKYYYHNSWTLLHQFAEILLNSGLSIDNSSRAILFLSTLCFGISSFLIVNKLTFNKYLALLVSILMLILQKNFGDTDYPSLIISNHSYGMLSLAITSLIFSLLINENFKLLGFFSTFLICIHPVVGLWVLFILTLSLILLKNRNILIKFLKGSFFGASCTLLSFIIFFQNKISKVDFETENLNIYLEFWDGHRNTAGIIHYEYLIKSIFLFILVNVYYYFNKNQKNNFLLFFNLMIVFASVIYLLFKFFPSFFPELFVRAMPSRFLILHSFVGWPLIISMIYQIFSGFNATKKFIRVFIFGTLIIYSVQHYKNFIKIKNEFVSNFSVKNKYKNADIFYEISNLNLPGYFITTTGTQAYTIRLGLKPVLIDTASLDFIPYHPYLVNDVFEILQEVYDVDLKNPPIKNNPTIPDNFTKISFEKKKEEDWKFLSEKYNADYVVTPTNWDIQLNIFLQNKEFSIYKIN